MRENTLLARIRALCGDAAPGVPLTVGDDAAEVRIASGRVLAAVDPVIVGVHVAADAAPARIGEKALKRNLSDLAAMAAAPRACLLQLTVPRGTDEDFAFEVVRGVHACGFRFGCPLVGGDVAVAPAGPLIASVTVLGEPWPDIEPVRRSGAQPGDHLYVSGVLGGSLAGHHLDFIPRLELAKRLAADPATRPVAMMDLSDGLGQDLPRLAPHALVDIPRLPVSPAAKEGWRSAVGDGEDYELLFAVRPEQMIPAELAGVRLTCIGEVRAGGGCRLMGADGTVIPLEGFGWEHRA